MSAGMGGGNPDPSKRGVVSGWSPGAVRRHTRWLYSVDSPELDGDGFAITLTVRDIPDTHDEFVAARRAFLMRLNRWGAVRVHWVVEWTARKRPHLHMFVYFPDGWAASEALAKKRIVDSWLAVADHWGAQPQGQHVAQIRSVMGWLEYLSKHAARGYAHYQRQGKPPGWEKTGRLWGHTGEWPASDPMTYEVSRQAYWRFRRLVRGWRIADARQALLDASTASQRRTARRRLAAARRMLACPTRKLSEVRGVSEWTGESAVAGFLELLAGEGHHLLQK